MLKRLFTVIMLCVGVQLTAAAIPDEFSNADWAAIPTLGEITAQEMMELFAGPIEKNGRVWALASFDHEDIRTVIADGQFEVIQIYKEEAFAHQPFEVDSLGVVLYKVWLVSLTQTYPPEEEDGNVFIEALLPISTQLTAEELTNPIIKAVQSDMTFEEEFELALENRTEYQRSVELRNAWYRLIFLTPEHKAKRMRELLAHEANFQ